MFMSDTMKTMNQAITPASFLLSTIIYRGYLVCHVVRQFRAQTVPCQSGDASEEQKLVSGESAKFRHKFSVDDVARKSDWLGRGLDLAGCSFQA